MKKCLFFLLFFCTSFLFSQSIQWEQLNGPFGGTPTCFASNSNGNIFSGSDDYKGFFRSVDEGLTFQSIINGVALDYRNVGWIVVDSADNLIAGAGSHVGAYVFRSTDNGENWTSIFSGLGGSCVAQNDSGHIYVGNTGFGQYSVSKDGGYTWNHYSGGGGPCIAINDSGHIFFGGQVGRRSTDRGATWTNMSGVTYINSIAVAPNGNLFAGTSEEHTTYSGVFKSTNNGNSWTPVKEGFRVYPSHNIVINTDGHIFVGSYGWGIWRSTDDGATWTQQNSGLGHIYIKSMHISNDGSVYAGTVGGGIYRSVDNCESWQQVGLISAYVKVLAVSPSNGFLFASTVGMSRSKDNGLTWEPINNGLSSRDVNNSEIKSISIKPDGTIFIGFTNNWPTTFVYRSTDNGDSWVLAQSGLQAGDIKGLTVDDSDNVYASNSAGVFKSTNNGVSWYRIGNVPDGKLKFNSLGDLFLGSYCGGLWKLPAGDTVWVDLTSNYGSSCIYSFFISSNDYLYTDQKRSTDNGLTWTPMPLGNMAYSYAENSQGHLFAGTFNYGSGVKRSTDFGVTWVSINSGIPTNDVRSVAIDADGFLYSGPWGYSLYKTTTSTVTSVEDMESIPSSFSLGQNYPNPFNPSTKISWQSPVSGWTTLKVFDMLGREVATLVDEYKQAGKYEFGFRPSANGSDFGFSTGVYYYRLTIGEYTATKKFLLLK
ncbi:MAG: T9SS type A sorting domain-containing protein [Bacteroidota bacterium]|nr:T9SS type A sorting domain-containing protein [Bacteroidota bacterium]